MNGYTSPSIILSMDTQLRPRAAHDVISEPGAWRDTGPGQDEW